MVRIILKKILILLLSLTLCGCTEKKTDPEPESAEFFAMDTYITVTAYGDKSALSEAENRVKELEKLLSVTDENSEIYALNHGSSVELSSDTKNVISFALDMADATNGALEPTIYPVLKAWGFTTNNYRIPEPDEISQLLRNVGYERVNITDNSLSLPKDMELDLGAVAKGYAGDEAIKVLKEHGVTSALINLGGNVQTVGTKPNGDLWRVGLKAPWSDGNIGVLEISDSAVITSGNYQRYFTGADGKKYHHIIDKSTGSPAESGLTSVTVVGREGKMCDALSTALFVMGADDAIEYWRHNDNFEMILITNKNEIFLTEGLESSFVLLDEYSDCQITVVRK